MKFGFFDDDRKEYVIHTPYTPLPWINYLGNDGFFSLISHTGGGYSFYKDAKLRRITRYRYNNVPRDMGGRNYYIKEKDFFWSPSFLPAKTPLDTYSCRHGLGYTIFKGAKNALQAELTCFIPLGYNCEINQLVLTNKSDQLKTIELFSGLEWCLYNTIDDAQNFQRNLNIGEVEIEGSTIYHKTEYRERRNHYAFYSVNAPISGFDTDRDSFLGPFNGWDNPNALKDGCKNSLGIGWSPIASHQLHITLAPYESQSYIFLLGYVENKEEEKWESEGIINKTLAKEIQEAFATDAKVNSALEKLALYWSNLLSTFSILSTDEKLNRMVNIWNQYQCMVTFNMSRSASYFESGTGRGMGFRDSCQDLLGFVHLIPDRARERILDIASIQFEDGSTYHQYQPLTKEGNNEVGSGFNDDPLWLIACTSAYIRETGDHSILEERLPFNNVAGSEETLFTHLQRSINYTMNHLGPHGLPLIGRADWNDCLNLNCFSTKPGESFQTCSNFESGKAESIFIGAMFVKYGKEYAKLCEHFGRSHKVPKILEAVAHMENAILNYGWDGEWFLRAYDAFSQPIGSHLCHEGKIFIEPQGFCVMAGIGLENGYAKKALLSVEKHLTTPYGIVLLTPPYSKYYKELGEISSYPPGYKENGSIFCHNNPWISIAHTLVGNAEEAFEAYKRICPAYLEEFSEIHATEPYVYSQTIGGIASKNFGQAKNSWLTGTAAWTFVNISQYILGIRPTLEGLQIKPCLPRSLPGYTAIRYFRNCKYTICVKPSATGEYALIADGHKLEGYTLPLPNGKTTCEVTVLI